MVLALLQAEAADVAERAERLALVLGVEGLRDVLDDRENVSASWQSSRIGSMSHGLPNRCVTTTALVRW
jgi:hypothetical protein